MISKMLIATDGSEHALKAVAFGADIAAKYDAEVVLAHALLHDEVPESLRRAAEVEYGPLVSAGQPAGGVPTVPHARVPIAEVMPESAEPTTAEIRAVGDWILSASEDVARRHGVTRIKREILEGDPAERIVGLVAETGADVVVTGSRGLSPLKAALVGSVSSRIAKDAEATVISVR